MKRDRFLVISVISLVFLLTPIYSSAQRVTVKEPPPVIKNTGNINVNTGVKLDSTLNTRQTNIKVDPPLKKEVPQISVDCEDKCERSCPGGSASYCYNDCRKRCRAEMR